MTTTETFTKLTEELKRIHYLGSAMGLLGWDEQVNLPSGAAEHRGAQMAVLSDIVHRESTSAYLGDLLGQLEADTIALDEDQLVILGEARKQFDRATLIPPRLVAEKAKLDSQSYHQWVKAREASDFSAFAPYLDRQIRLSKEIASLLGYEGNSAYEYYLDLHDPGLTSGFLDTVFADLREQLVPLADRIVEVHGKKTIPTLKGFPVLEQESFLRKVIQDMGFDFAHGRLDRSVHPFCGGEAQDIRMTTRFDPDNPLDSLFSAIHETGHALYEQGLPQTYLGTALSSAVGMAIHESQSRLWENQVGRSRAFWHHYEPLYRQAFGGLLEDVDSDSLYRAINAVSRCPIRVDSDEVNYNLHILLRYELEKKLFYGELEVNDLPEAWNTLSRDLLKLNPANDREGCLQDVHWSGGAFGYFPSYTLGNMIAAQLWDSICVAIPEVETEISKGNFQPLLSWLRENVHQHGRRWDTRQLTRKVTGKDICPDSLIRYLGQRYGME